VIGAAGGRRVQPGRDVVLDRRGRDPLPPLGEPDDAEQDEQREAAADEHDPPVAGLLGMLPRGAKATGHPRSLPDVLVDPAGSRLSRAELA
jgi:hypothetical protein